MTRLSHALVAALCLGVTARVAAADWPQWRGPERDGHASEASLPGSLPAELKRLWKLSVGPGFAAPVVTGKRLIYLDETAGQETAHCLDAVTGQELWMTPFAKAVGDEWGRGPRSTPFVDGDRVYVQSCNGEFHCLRLEDGKDLWGFNFEKDYGVRFLGSKAGEGTATRRGNNGSGLCDGNRVFVPVGGTSGASVVCRDKLTGRELWKSGNDEAAYSSFIMATLAGRRQLVALTADSLSGFDSGDGRILWRVPLTTNAKRHAATPVLLGNDRVAVNSHSFGLLAFQIERSGEAFTVSPAWTNKALKINLATPVRVGANLYTHGTGRSYVCVDAATGRQLWNAPNFGTDDKKDWSATIAAGERLLVLTESGELLLLDASPEKLTPHGRVQVCGHTWCHPALADGRLYVRDGATLQCYALAP